MIRLFRNIRKQLAGENKPAKYMRYAIGEVVLIMLGIFMALQLQNWNVERKQEIQFKQSLEQLYNIINDDFSNYGNTNRMTRDALEGIDFLLNNPDSEYQRYYGGAYWFFFNFFRTMPDGMESIKAIDNIQYNPNDERQVNLVSQLNSYREVIHRTTRDFFTFDDIAKAYLSEKMIPQPGIDIDSVHFGIIDDLRFYSKEEVFRAKELLSDPYFRGLLKSQSSALTFKHLDYKMLEADAQSIMNLIKDYFPEVRLLYQNVGIIGTSINGFDDAGARSTPMTLLNEEEQIWTVQIYLKVGRVKFRCRDSWAINWGGVGFPNGEGLSNGPDIDIPEAGNYQIILNLSQKTYEFNKLDVTN